MTQNEDELLHGLAMRLKQYFAWKRVKTSHVAQKMGVHPMTVTRMISGNSFKAETLKNLGLVYPELNLDWLFTGQGAMEINPSIEENDPWERQLDLLYSGAESLNDEEKAMRSTQLLDVVKEIRYENHKLTLELADQIFRTMKVYKELNSVK